MGPIVVPFTAGRGATAVFIFLEWGRAELLLPVLVCSLVPACLELSSNIKAGQGLTKLLHFSLPNTILFPYKGNLIFVCSKEGELIHFSLTVKVSRDS